jgi:hypothetical protein
MFLFRRKKENTGENIETAQKAGLVKSKDGQIKVKNPVKKVEPLNPARNKVSDVVKPSGVSVKVTGTQPVKVSQAKSEKTAMEAVKGKVVIPASALESDDTNEELIPTEEDVIEPVPEEVLDGLLVPMNTAVVQETEDFPTIDLAEVMGKPEVDANPQSVIESKEFKDKPMMKGTGKSSNKDNEKESQMEQLKAEPVNKANCPAVAGVEPAKPESPEVSPKTESAKKEGRENAKADNQDDINNKDNLFSSLFGQTVEKEETPIDRLIKSLPDITIEEVMNEAEEVQCLINEIYQNQG